VRRTNEDELRRVRRDRILSEKKCLCSLCKIREATFHACDECIKRDLKDFEDSTVVWIRKKTKEGV
jgi:primosomal protein N'